MPRTLMALCAAVLLAGPAVAKDLTNRQQSAYDAILPELELSLEEQGNEALLAMAPMLATCIVTGAERAELRKLGRGAFEADDAKLLNQLMLRPAIQGCVAKEAANQ
ncbi:MAG: hypothetical protein AAF092_09845 [Pseudomonadota bacterium]